MGDMVRGLCGRLYGCRGRQKMGWESGRNNVRSCKQKYVSEKQGWGGRKKGFLKMVALHQSTIWRGRGNSRSGQAKTQRCEMPVVGIRTGHNGARITRAWQCLLRTRHLNKGADEREKKGNNAFPRQAHLLTHLPVITVLVIVNLTLQNSSL